MTEIAALPHNGFYAVSTFSGCGGSSLGYKMAGYKVLWANEFIPAAQDTYRANHPGTILDTRDIRQVNANDILDAIQMQPGQLDLFDGSPPCASFSTSGKREAGWGKVKAYSDTKQRVDDLFFEYTRLIQGVQPKVFVAENVSGLVKGTAKGYFLEILAALKECGYNVEARLLDAQWLGVPQMRQRLIFVGVRKDLELAPAFPKPLPYQYSVRDALQNVPVSYNAYHLTDGKMLDLWRNTQPFDSFDKAYLRLYGKSNAFTHKRLSWSRPSCTLQTARDVYHPEEPRSLTIPEMRRVCSFPDDFVLTGTYMQQWERMGRAVPPVMMSHIAAAVRDHILCKIKS